ncbi:jg8292 [Pararge aegeria aegeria]|uniref:Jg8292 protein n=1 Tax=Pararge aegeria aegeria TaxID=348720 RepID=A0A8S4RBV9_9NEOP|nr:jg8292 [Pararge aegeria aegeria]
MYLCEHLSLQVQRRVTSKKCGCRPRLYASAFSERLPSDESGRKQLKVPSETPPAVQVEAQILSDPDIYLGPYFHLITLEGNVVTSWRTSAWAMEKKGLGFRNRIDTDTSVDCPPIE